MNFELQDAGTSCAYTDIQSEACAFSAMVEWNSEQSVALFNNVNSNEYFVHS